MAKLPEAWEQFLKGYRSNGVYWFFPKAGNADEKDFREKFRIFSLFDGRQWEPALQEDIRKEMRAKGLTTARPKSAFVRMLKRSFENASLCIVQPNEPIQITSAGVRYLKESGRSVVLDEQVWRYSHPTPVNAESQCAGLSLNPHAFLMRVMLAVGDKVSKEEFFLFIARARTASEHSAVVKLIRAWRKLGVEDQREIVRRAKADMRKVEGNHTYAMAFHSCDLALEKTTWGLSIRSGRREAVRARLAAHSVAPALPDDVAKAVDPLDWVTIQADEDATLSIDEALDRAVDRSDVKTAVKLYKKLAPTKRAGRTVAEFEKNLLQEVHLEQYLAAHLDKIEQGLKPIPLKKLRQHRTPIGVLDLYAQSAEGDLVVIELKKVRADDKVFGQICRYIGYVQAAEAAPKQKVRGYIVGSDIHIKLQYASTVTSKGRIRLKKFERTRKGTDWSVCVLDPAQ